MVLQRCNKQTNPYWLILAGNIALAISLVVDRFFSGYAASEFINGFGIGLSITLMFSGLIIWGHRRRQKERS